MWINETHATKKSVCLSLVCSERRKSTPCFEKQKTLMLLQAESHERNREIHINQAVISGEIPFLSEAMISSFVFGLQHIIVFSPHRFSDWCVNEAAGMNCCIRWQWNGGAFLPNKLSAHAQSGGHCPSLHSVPDSEKTDHAGFPVGFLDMAWHFVYNKCSFPSLLP